MEETGYELIFPHVWHEQKKSSKEFIKNADLVIGEVSFPSTGQGIEFGWADMLNVPTLFLKKTGAKASSSPNYLKGELIEYATLEELTSKTKAYLTEK